MSKYIAQIVVLGKKALFDRGEIKWLNDMSKKHVMGSYERQTRGKIFGSSQVAKPSIKPMSKCEINYYDKMSKLYAQKK